MKIEYSKPIYEKLNEAILEAKRIGKTIEVIRITELEAVELFDYFETKFIFPNKLDGRFYKEKQRQKCNMIDNSYYAGILVKVDYSGEFI